MSFLLPPVADVQNDALRIRLQERLDRKHQPLGALGELEALVMQLGLVQASDLPQLREPQLLVCAGDHGLAVHGVSAHKGISAADQAQALLQGRAAAGILARQQGLPLTVVDCGLAQPVRDTVPGAGLRARLQVLHLGPGTADVLGAPAMTLTQCHQAIDNGRNVVRALPGNVVLLGALGVGSSSAAAMLLARLAPMDIDRCTGAGSGLDNVGLDHKIRVLTQALQQHAVAAGPMAALATLGGFEMATLVGAVLQSAHERRLVVVDGFVTGVAVLVAQRLCPEVAGYCVFSHRSAERGHALLLDTLAAHPVLNLDVRLDDGCGAVLLWPVLDAACRLLHELPDLA